MEPEKWSQLHDIALLYVCCMHGPDASIDPSELELVRKLVSKRSPSVTRARAIMDEVLLMYVGTSGADMLVASIASLHESMTDENRVSLLQELADIASADGVVYPNEVQFIVWVAEQWGLSGHLPRD